METGESFRPGDRVGITEQGRADLIFAPTCRCEPKLTGYLVTCQCCGTVYGHLKELDREPALRQRRNGR